ncbi:MAG TPA: hypothetical protein VGM39_26095 [Kofleriaceae bacterium]|jgi:hypothetical protein
MRFVLYSLAIGLVLGACAKGGAGDVIDGSVDEGRGDSGLPPEDAMRPDGHAPIDAAPPIDATPPIDSPMVDAAMPDAMCTPVTTELLTNGPFDTTPAGTGWTEEPGDPTYPLITNTGSLAADTPAYKAWLGGLEADDYGLDEIDDFLYQDVVIPANTTSITLTAKYAVASAETESTVYDTGFIGALDGSTVLFVKSLDNTTVAGTWTATTNTSTANLSGKTIRIQAEAENDYYYPTSFYFDTLSLKATHCP